MEPKDISTYISNGAITYKDRDEQAELLQWNEHPKFKGVYLKHLVTGRDTDGALSCHMVKIDPNSALEEHIHENQLELHEVIEGAGNFILGDKETRYSPGGMAVIPKGIKHKVIAGEKGLILLAKFCPALL
jgi:quercetin dioxygenase-like cupin family protein